MLLVQQPLLNLLFGRALTYLGIVIDYDLLNIGSETATVMQMMVVVR